MWKEYLQNIKLKTVWNTWLRSHQRVSAELKFCIPLSSLNSWIHQKIVSIFLFFLLFYNCTFRLKWEDQKTHLDVKSIIFIEYSVNIWVSRLQSKNSLLRSLLLLVFLLCFAHIFVARRKCSIFNICYMYIHIVYLCFKWKKNLWKKIYIINMQHHQVLLIIHISAFFHSWQFSDYRNAFMFHQWTTKWTNLFINQTKQSIISERWDVYENKSSKWKTAILLQ